MTVRKLLTESALFLKNKSASPELDSEVLLSFVFNQNRACLLSNLSKEVPRQKANKFQALLKQRTLGVPISYLVKEKEFKGLSFFVDKRVLVPRPETETLVETVLEGIKNQPQIKDILDIGTGSGNIIVSLAKALGQKRRYFASDVSARALKVAQLNAKKHKVKIKFKKIRLIKGWGRSFGAVVANLPYGWRQWTNKVTPLNAGLKHEPYQALFAGNNGLRLIKQLLKEVGSLKPPVKYLYLEFDPRQRSMIRSAAKKYLPNYRLSFGKDLFGRTRYAVIEYQG
jgi:release factor glutamine methyltransferase